MASFSLACVAADHFLWLCDCPPTQSRTSGVGDGAHLAMVCRTRWCWIASSLVGATTTDHWLVPCAVLARAAAAKDTVFPVPLFACTMRCFPWWHLGITTCCTGVGRLNPRPPSLSGRRRPSHSHRGRRRSSKDAGSPGIGRTSTPRWSSSSLPSSRSGEAPAARSIL